MVATTEVKRSHSDLISPFLVFGALLGQQKGRSIEICNSYELVVNVLEGKFALDTDYFLAKEEQC